MLEIKIGQNLWLRTNLEFIHVAFCTLMEEEFIKFAEFQFRKKLSRKLNLCCTRTHQIAMFLLDVSRIH